MPTLDHKSREKWQRKCQRVETENIKITQALCSKTDNPSGSPIYICKTPPLILQANALMLLTKSNAYNFQKKSKTKLK